MTRFTYSVERELTFESWQSEARTAFCDQIAEHLAGELDEQGLAAAPGTRHWGVYDLAETTKGGEQWLEHTGLRTPKRVKVVVSVLAHARVDAIPVLV